MSTLSNKKSKNSFESSEGEGSPPSSGKPELRDRTGPPAPRPVTIAAPAATSVTSAPNLLVLNKVNKVTGKPRMPDPEPETELHVNRIHVSGTGPVAPGVTNSVYMNVPKHPEYVNYADSKHPYVNVPAETNQPSTPKRKPFLLLSFIQRL